MWTDEDERVVSFSLQLFQKTWRHRSLLRMPLPVIFLHIDCCNDRRILNKVFFHCVANEQRSVTRISTLLKRFPRDQQCFPEVRHLSALLWTSFIENSNNLEKQYERRQPSTQVRSAKSDEVRRSSEDQLIRVKCISSRSFVWSIENYKQVSMEFVSCFVRMIRIEKENYRSK